ncbi:hypothetical protein GCM10027569_42810 [Flindersiella endophytica]
MALQGVRPDVAAAADGVSGRVTDVAGAALPNVEVVARRPDGSEAGRGRTKEAGEYAIGLPPGAYQATAYAAGYDPQERDVSAGGPAKADFALTATTKFSGTGRMVPGPVSEGTPQDIVLANDLLAMAVAVSTVDAELPGRTTGKPVDLAAVGHLDQLDWLSLPYAASAPLRGPDAWSRGLVSALFTELPSARGARAEARSVGFANESGDVLVTTTYSIAPGEPWVAVESVFANGWQDGPIVAYVGDVIDRDGDAQRSGVAGHGVITTPEDQPAEYVPAGTWIGMAGNDRQTYGLVYEDEDFVAYGTGAWMLTERRIELPAGETYTLRRRIVAIDNGDDNDPFAVLERLSG